MKTVVCAIIKNEHRFLKEWVDYHLSIGFDHIYLYEDYGSKSHRDIVRDYSKVSLCTVKDDTPVSDHHNSGTQACLYNWFLQKARKEGDIDWILFTDIDEFLCFDEGYNLSMLCEEFKEDTGVWLCWKFYTANGHIERPEGGVLENYTEEASPEERSDRDLRWQFKSLVNVHKASTTAIHEVTDGVNVRHLHEYPDRIYEKAWINHYFTKSWEDYCERMLRRGNMSNDYRTFDTFFTCNSKMLPLKKSLIESIRSQHTVSTFWISKDLKIISGGNQGVIEKLNRQYARK